MKLHADHRTVFETQHGVLSRQVAYFERAEDAQEYVRLCAALTQAEEIAKAASLMIEDEYHVPIGCRFTGAGENGIADMEDEDIPEGNAEVTEVTCWACLVQDNLATIRVEALTKAASGEEGEA